MEVLIAVSGSSMSRCKDLSRWRPLLPADVILEDTSQDVAAAHLPLAANDSPDCLVAINSTKIENWMK